MTLIRWSYGVRDRLRNVDMRTDFGETNVVDETEHYRRKWKEHILRMPPKRHPQQALIYIPTGVRDLWQPSRWREQF
jgi:hypothetical protein